MIGPLGSLITTLPIGRATPGWTAGPSFELFYQTDYLMPHREAAWALLEERVREAANFCGLIEEIGSGQVAQELGAVRNGLSDVADVLASHFSDWGATSRFATTAHAAPQTDETATRALSARAATLARSVLRPGPRPTPVDSW